MGDRAKPNKLTYSESDRVARALREVLSFRTNDEGEPDGSECVYYAPHNDQTVLAALRERIPGLTLRNIEGVREGIFGKLAREEPPAPGEARLLRLEEQVISLAEEIARLHESFGALLELAKRTQGSTIVGGAPVDLSPLLEKYSRGH